MIDQILEFRKMETSVPENRLIHGDIISDIRESVSLMKPLWEEKKIVFSSAFSDESFFAWYDVDKVERVVSNLLGNAIKYSNLGGSISVKANIRWGIKQDQDASLLEFIVEDNGLGRITSYNVCYTKLLRSSNWSKSSSNGSAWPRPRQARTSAGIELRPSRWASGRR